MNKDLVQCDRIPYTLAKHDPIVADDHVMELVR